MTCVKFLTCLFLIIALQETFAQEDDAETYCKGVPIAMNDTQKAVVKSCLKQFNAEKVAELAKNKISCFGVCVWKNKGLLTLDGKLDHDRILAYVQAVMKPDELKKPLSDGIEECFKKFAGAVLDDGTPACKGYEETGQCVHDIFVKLCQT